MEKGEEKMRLALVQGCRKDPDFDGIILLSDSEKGGYDRCEWNGKVSSPHPISKDGDKEIWLPLFNDEDTLNAFIGEKKLRENTWFGKIWWDKTHTK